MRPDSMPQQAPLVAKGHVVPFVLLTLCFAAWGVANNMTDPLVNGFKSIWQMSHLQAALVQSAFYGAYFCLALPAALLIKRTTYKTGVLVGLALFIVGSLLFWPASQTMVYEHFLAALFVLASGLSVLETSCNPYVLAMGPEVTATRRLNLAQSFNPVGSNVGLVLAGLFILPHLGRVPEAQRAAMPASVLRGVQAAELQAVMGPYVGMAVVLTALWIVIAFFRMPEARDTAAPLALAATFRRLIRRKPYVLGVVTQFFYVGAQICVWTFTLVFVQALPQTRGVDAAALYAPVQTLHELLVAVRLKPSELSLPTLQEMGGLYLQASLLLFLVSRFVFTALMQVVAPTKLLVASAAIAAAGCALVIFGPGRIGLVGLLAISACMSMMFPTIYGIALRGLGEDAKLGGAGLVMAILGGALLPLGQGALVDRWGAGASYLLPFVCFWVVFAYARLCHRSHQTLNIVAKQKVA